MRGECMQELTTTNNQDHNSIWRQAMYYVLFGLMFSSASFNMLGLNYILPIIGLLLLWIGFRRLQYETQWFRVCWGMTSLRIVFEVISLCINATIWNAMLMQTGFRQVIVVLNLILSFGTVLCFWLGMRNIRHKLSESVHNSAAGWFVLWYIILIILALLQLGSVLGLVMMILYFIVFYRLFKLSAQIDDLGYQAQNVVNIRKERCFAGLVSVVLMLGISVGYLCFNQYPMEWSLVSDEAKQTQSSNEVYQHLKTLGVDEYVLQDLSPEDLAACKDAIRVQVEKDFEIGNWQNDYTDNTLNLDVTHVAIEIPSDTKYSQWRIIHHFQWSEPLEYYGTEGLKLWPTYIDHNNTTGWGKASEMTGQVLYNADNKSYKAPYYTLGTEHYQFANFFIGMETKEAVFAGFSYPKGGESYRGYVTYATEQHKDTFIDSLICYAHHRDWAQYPVQTGIEFLKTTTHSKKAFTYRQKILQVHPPTVEDGE